jgi:hypothetical protein
MKEAGEGRAQLYDRPYALTHELSRVDGPRAISSIGYGLSCFIVADRFHLLGMRS